MKKYGYFGPDTKDDVLTDDECYIGFVLNHFLEVNQFNAHEVAQVFFCLFHNTWLKNNPDAIYGFFLLFKLIERSFQSSKWFEIVESLK